MTSKWGLVADHIPLRFVVAASIAYLLTCIQGPFQATRAVNWYLHFSNWVVGHAHLALLAHPPDPELRPTKEPEDALPQESRSDA